MRPVALTIAGSDPSGGAGIQADLKTFHQFGIYGEAVVTLLTVQNTRSIERVECLAPDLVLAQLRAVLDDIPPAAAKTGALGNHEIVQAVANMAREFQFPLVVDPVMLSKEGVPLLSKNARQTFAALLLPRAFLLTPNLEEAGLLADMEIHDSGGMRQAARRLCEMGANAVLVKGGHLPGDAMDVLYYRGDWREFRSARIETRHTHGTGCAHSAAITAELARGAPLETAIARAKAFIFEAVRTSPGLGAGAGPVNHHAPSEQCQGAPK